MKRQDHSKAHPVEQISRSTRRQSNITQYREGQQASPDIARCQPNMAVDYNTQQAVVPKVLGSTKGAYQTMNTGGRPAGVAGMKDRIIGSGPEDSGKF